jgi:hypothetical protein
MKLVQDVLKNQYDALHDTYMKAHNEHSRAQMELNRFSKEISKLVKWSQDSGVVYLSYGQEIYEVHKNKKKQKDDDLIKLDRLQLINASARFELLSAN